MNKTSQGGTEDDTPTGTVRRRSAPAADPTLLADLAVANRILAHHRVVDAFGHVSVRHDQDPDRFLLSANKAPARVREQDILEFDLDGNALDAEGRSVYLERFIHGEIYRARQDVMAVVHSHAHAVVPFGVAAGTPLQPVWHMSGFLGLTTPIFEIRDHGGADTDLLIRSGELGRALAQTLGEHSVVLMRGHGATVVAGSLKMAVFRAVYTQVNAELQLNALQLGEVNYLNAGEAASTTTAVGGQVDRAWQLWKEEVL
jgi:HCOMODA/2-hydroxy-3-carboxy-muconic semialdehyde decarboxylase